MTIKQKVLGAGLGIALGLGLIGCRSAHYSANIPTADLQAQVEQTVTQTEQKQGPKLRLGNNALETAITDKNDIRSRLFTNVGVDYQGVLFDFHGMNQINNMNDHTYFGRNVFGIGPSAWSTEAIAALKFNNEKVLDSKYGFRNTCLPAKIADYGWVDVTADTKAGNFQTFLGWKLGERTTLEALQSFEKPYEGKTSKYTELQLNYRLFDHVEVFGRIETNNFDFNQATHLVGITLKY